MPSPSFTSIVKSVIRASTVNERLKSTGAVVLERMARGGGATRWYYCNGLANLPQISAALEPGSVVSFYFDGRMKRCSYEANVGRTIREIIEKFGEVIVGIIEPDHINIHMDVISGPKELDEYIAHISSGDLIVFGGFPSRENDGTAVVTLTIPDKDGIVRQHPH